MSNKQGLDTNCMTLTRFFLAEQRKHPQATGEFTQLLQSIQSAVKAISAAVRRAGISKFFGTVGETNVQGEEVKKLDVLSNELFINLLSSSYCCCLMVSEENENIIEVETEKSGKYIVCFDPLDGSSNIDCLVSIGSIFAIYKKPDNPQVSKEDAVLQPGRNILAAGYALYGSATMMVISLGGSVNGFMLDPSIGEFLLTDPDMRVPSKGKYYAVNEGYENKWMDPGLAKYVKDRKEGKKPYGARYVGSMVADVHRTIKYGGIFMYPRTTDSPNGKLRIMYECNPMAHIMETAGGKAIDGNIPILDVVPKNIHDRVPIFLGSTGEVDDLLGFFKEAEQ